MKRPLAFSYCEATGKVKFDKKGAVTAKNKRWKEDHVELREYPCGDCHCWHLTSRMTDTIKSKRK